MRLGIRTLTIVKLAFAFGLLAWLFFSGFFDVALFAGLADRWLWFVLAIVGFGVNLVLSAIRWAILLNAQEIRYKKLDVLWMTWIGQFFNQFVVGSTGGDFYRGYLVASDHPTRRTAAVMSVIVDRSLGLLALMLIVVIAWAPNVQTLAIHPELYSLVVVAVAVLVAVFLTVAVYRFVPSKKRRSLLDARWFQKLQIKNILLKFDEVMETYGRDLKVLVVALSLSAVVQIIVILNNVFLTHALVSEPYDVGLLILLIPIAYLLMAVPLNPPGAIGTAEAIYAFLFLMLGVEEGAAICLLQRLAILFWAAGGAVVYVLYKRSANPATTELSADHE